MGLRKTIAACACATFGLLALATAGLPLGVEAQLAISGSALLAMALIRLARLQGPLRSIHLGLGAFVVLRYLFWRYSSTLPPIDNPLDFVPGFILVLAETYCVVMLFLSLFAVLDPLERPRAPRVADAEAPTVDVFVPSYNESTEILATTLAAAKAMAYPADRLRVFLLDDGGTDEKVGSDDPVIAARAAARRRGLQSLCAEMAVTYVTRADNSHAKAGNLNAGLDNSSGELVVVFDADHAPAREFLTETVGHFADPKLFLVQTPHFFLNPDPIEKNVGAQRMPAENEMFYGLVQKGLDRWNAAFFCGSAAVLRRAALEQVGGFHGSSITEDAETALELHSRGWHSLYVDKPMIAGLQPETFESFIGQRSRWCRGMVQILLLKTPLFKAGLTLPQRLCYMSSSMFWLFPLSRLIFIIAPMFYIFFNLKIYIANQQEFIAYTLTYMVASLMIQSYIFGRFRWPWASDVYEYVQAVPLFLAVLSVFLHPRRPKFNVTDKGLSLAQSRLSAIAAPYFAIFGLVSASMAAVVYRYAQEPNSRDLLLVVGVWTALNLVLTGLAIGAVSERRERRTVPRVGSRKAATLTIGLDQIPVVIRDMSYGGLRVQPLVPFAVPGKASGTLTVASESGGPAFETAVVSCGRRISGDDHSFGLRFHGYGANRFRIVAQTVFADVGRVHALRSEGYRTRGIIVGSLQMLGLWMGQTSRGLYFATFNRTPAEAEPSPVPQRQTTSA